MATVFLTFTPRSKDEDPLIRTGEESGFWSSISKLVLLSGLAQVNLDRRRTLLLHRQRPLVPFSRRGI